jgi:hypothetical protein
MRRSIISTPYHILLVPSHEGEWDEYWDTILKSGDYTTFHILYNSLLTIIPSFDTIQTQRTSY